MNSKELIEQLDSTRTILVYLNNQKNALDEKEQTLTKVIRSSSCFNITDVTKIVAELVSKKEKTTYIPFIFDVDVCDFWGRSHMDTFFTIAESGHEMTVKHKCIDYAERSEYLQNINYPFIIDVINHSKYEGNPRKADITFYNIVEKYTNINFDKNTRICIKNLDDCQYVTEFVNYLFELQFQNNSKHLTYEEMQVALNDFLELEKDISKTKIKSLSLKIEENN